MPIIFHKLLYHISGFLGLAISTDKQVVSEKAIASPFYPLAGWVEIGVTQHHSYYFPISANLGFDSLSSNLQMTSKSG
ncbi:MAG: hypothetical protein KFF72_05840 [Arthrospira sp. SH-MAG29]|nr:hypothetical protein [Arthrospira sp. SH-MAG29]MBS0015872.1 hypothetical protein [Arthrospira sp. SH-MAG29]